MKPIRCLLTTLLPETSLSRALVQHLSVEMPGINFELRRPNTSGASDVSAAADAPDAPDAPDALWVCGYRPSNAQVIRVLRKRYPKAALIVTGRGPIEAWEPEVLSAGADSACTWPLPYRRLANLLKQGRGVRLRPA